MNDPEALVPSKKLAISLLVGILLLFVVAFLTDYYAESPPREVVSPDELAGNYGNYQLFVIDEDNVRVTIRTEVPREYAVAFLDAIDRVERGGYRKAVEMRVSGMPSTIILSLRCP